MDEGRGVLVVVLDEYGTKTLVLIAIRCAVHGVIGQMLSAAAWYLGYCQSVCETVRIPQHLAKATYRNRRVTVVRRSL